MNKYLITGIIVLIASVSMNAQDISKNALGLRLGDNDGFGGEISYQARLSSTHRLELDLGWRDGKNYDGFKLAALHQWVWNIDGGFNWYAGLGGGVGSYSFKDDKNFNNGDNYNDTFVFAAGDIGIEYNFDIPLLISLDFRPEIGFGDERYNNNDLGLDIALGIRYQF
jgi:opacity protein-like surface antigen